MLSPIGWQFVQAEFDVLMALDSIAMRGKQIRALKHSICYPKVLKT